MITIEDVLNANGQPVGAISEESVREAEYSLGRNEQASYALISTFSFDGHSHAGVVVVTPLQVVFCSSISSMQTRIHFPFSCCIGIGDAKGFLLKEIPITCEGYVVRVKAAKENLDKLRTSIMDAIEAFSPRAASTDKPFIFHQDPIQAKEIAAIKSPHKGERRLSRTEVSAYGSCPDCNGKMLVEKGGYVLCARCQHQFGPLKK